VGEPYALASAEVLIRWASWPLDGGDGRSLFERMRRWEGDPRWSGFQPSETAAGSLVSALSQHMGPTEQLRDADLVNRSSRTSRAWTEHVSLLAVPDERVWLAEYRTP
jgi:hypothetical protein